MRKQLILAAMLAGCFYPSVASAQFGQGANPPANSTFLPRAGSQRLNSQQFYPFGYGNPQNNYYNNAYGFGGYGNNGYGNNGYGNNGWNPNGNYAFGGYGSPFNNSWQGNPWQGNPFGGGALNNPYQTPWGFGNAFGPSAPFGGYQYNGYGNFAPIVGLNNGWWPYQPGYNYNNPVNQYLQQLYLQGLPGYGTFPGGNNGILPRNP